MKVFEVTKFSHHKIKSTGDEFRQSVGVRDQQRPSDQPKPKNKLIQVIGAGAYSTAVVNVNQPNQVMKISNGMASLASDPYFQYLSRIAGSKNSKANPYFPRVYEVRVYETTNPRDRQKLFYIANMERLQTLESLSEQELVDLIIKEAKPTMVNKVKSMVGMYDAKKQLMKQEKFELVSILVNKIRREKIRDPQLKAAMDLAAETGFEYDIHEYNLMVRKTPDGIQLVLADPVRD